MKILLVDDEIEERSYLAQVISGWDHDVRQAADGREAMEILSGFTPDVLLTDLMMPRLDGFELLAGLRKEGRLPPAIVMTAFGSLERALATIHDLGGFWYLEKPINTASLKVLIERAGAQSRLAAENQELKRQLSFQGVLGDLVGKSDAILRVFDEIRQVAPTSAPVLITGESGTGKELVARALHDYSRRREAPFIPLNCAAMPDTLVESELFGHEKGSFTGAAERRIGALEAADGGSLFLDELAEMPTSMQAKLLRVLEDLRFRRLGGRQELVTDIRLIAATNRDPAQAIRDGKLREDLYYRLNVFHINLPPLRERKEDIPLIVKALIHNLNRKHDTKVVGASPAFLELMSQRNWEGNVRELRNIVERAVILAGHGVLQLIHAEHSGSNVPASILRSAIEASAPGAVAVHVGMTVEEAERALIEATLVRVGNNKTRAAFMLGISTRTLHAKLHQYRIAAAQPLSEAAEA
jgi:DNA-binding NtrC family response regulator